MSKVFISRPDASVLWGFRLQGGVDYNEPLRIINVVANSPADGKIDPGDTLLEIGENNVINLKHQDALKLIQQCTNAMFLTVYKIHYTYSSTSNQSVLTVWKPSQQPQGYANYSPHSGGQPPQIQNPQPPNNNSASSYNQSNNFNNSWQNAVETYNFNPLSNNQYSSEASQQQQPIAAAPHLPSSAPSIPTQSSYIPMAPSPNATLIASTASTLRNHQTRLPIFSSQTSIEQTDLSNIPAALMKSLSRLNGPKPFTYIPGGLDLSKILESSRVRRHREHHLNSEDRIQQKQQSSIIMNRRVVPQEPMNHRYAASGPPNGYQPFSYARTQNSTPPPPPKKQIIHDTDVITQSRSFQMLQGWISDSEKIIPQANLTKSSVTHAIEDEQSDDRHRSNGSGTNAVPASRSFRYLQDQYPNGSNGTTTTTVKEEATTVITSNDQQQTGTGLRRGSDNHVPSRSFRYLQDHIESNPQLQGVPVNKSSVNNRDDLIEIYNKPPPSHREREAEAPKFTGSTIPSRSFRFLQMMTQEEKSNAKQQQRSITKPQVNLQSYEEEDHEDDIKFDGLPSKSFRYLQEITGESTRNKDTSEMRRKLKTRGIQMINHH
ncbi:unnamed protein product [Didymodactylos carnosus]|uniref:PDZ domain-containing protein n=1 Tax=Didymodactylos carnosus TaxID=1234261 RepID=A0A813UGF6_9BILA|nr:unnamed protein product [Didymodactylos carnosus]CAF0825577.1 unnamed protein product [Didymodactylos carnosus]CAF3601321.1 unnamed protein product [Didymodactylos carnosus]CAF3612320.1 unnamed protein product [Didymodactylos carnosus]